MSSLVRWVVFALFVASGFCGLVYQIVWMRLALADFGVITPVTSLVVSVFMFGMSIGSWTGGRFIEPLSRRTGLSAIAVYGLAELAIASGAFVLPTLFSVGRAWLLPMGEMDSGAYLFFSSLVIGAAMLPWCFCMGATYPLMMAFVERSDPDHTRSFSRLYLANVIGALVGTLATSIALVELYGFRSTLMIAGGINASIALVAFGLSRGTAQPSAEGVVRGTGEEVPRTDTAASARPAVRFVLFVSGFITMALEIVWMRAFTPVLGNVVYSFSWVLAVYLLATALGSWLYRLHSSRGHVLRADTLLGLVGLSALLPVFAADPNIAGTTPALLVSIFPFSGALGYLTPMLIDRDSGGRPEHAGAAYAYNIVGSIVGPLAAAYLLLPWLGPRLSIVLLTLPIALVLAALLVRNFARGQARRLGVSASLAGLTLVCLPVGAFYCTSIEEGSGEAYVKLRRDHTATTLTVFGDAGLTPPAELIKVNGRGMAGLTTITKVMAHLPLAYLEEPPEKGLVIAFGVGNTFRSMLTWGIDVTVVELVPSVRDAFGDFFEDAREVLANPRGHVVIDDGRRFLARSAGGFDVITIDPPPPLTAAASSLLYSEEFYALARSRLKPKGILQTWIPIGDFATMRSMARTVVASFPHVHFHASKADPERPGFGLHITASMSPLVVPDAETFIERMPETARRDLMEWISDVDLRTQVEDRILKPRVSYEEAVAGPRELTITDDHPINEYYLLERWWRP